MNGGSFLKASQIEVALFDDKNVTIFKLYKNSLEDNIMNYQQKKMARTANCRYINNNYFNIKLLLVAVVLRLTISTVDL